MSRIIRIIRSFAVSVAPKSRPLEDVQSPINIFNAQDSHTGMSREFVERIGEEAGFELTRCEQIHGRLWVYVLQLL